MPRPTRERRMDVPREPGRVRQIVTAIGQVFTPNGAGDYANGGGSTDWAMLIRDEGPLTVTLPARPERAKPVWNSSRATIDLVAYAEEQVSYLAHVASEVMQDNLGDEQTVHDMHDMIGSLASLRSALNLIKPEKPTPQEISEQLGEAIHTAFRKGSDHPNAWEAWKLINALPGRDWADLLYWIRSAMGLPQPEGSDGRS